VSLVQGRQREDTVMKIQSVTIGMPSDDLERSIAWYQRTFDLDRPDLEPVEGVVEFKLGPIWFQLGRDTVTRSGAEDVIEYFNFHDPDGNLLSMYAEVAS
jgi:catechol 2,3-dioxygenase-like lactoylglutathione lyase family enzyme